MVENVHLVCPFYIWDGINITDISCTILILPVCLYKNFTEFALISGHGIPIFFVELIILISRVFYFVGNYSGWKATCIGNNSSAAVSILKQEYKEGEMSLDGALDLSMKVLSKTLDMTKLTSDKIEVATLKRVDGKTKIHVLTTDEMNALIAKFEAEEKKAEEAKKAEGK